MERCYLLGGILCYSQRNHYSLVLSLSLCPFASLFKRPRKAETDSKHQGCTGNWVIKRKEIRKYCSQNRTGGSKSESLCLFIYMASEMQRERFTQTTQVLKISLNLS